jgi:hypothetical protein
MPSDGSPDGRVLITDMEGLEEVRELGSSRFGAVRLVRRRKERRIDGNMGGGGEGDVDGFEYFAAKYYNAGCSREGSRRFKDRMNKFISLSHRQVIRIAGIIGPTKMSGPIILTPYIADGSLESILTQVRQNNPPSDWNPLPLRSD